MPVATPMAKLMPKSLPQNRVMSLYISLPVMRYVASITTSRNDRPSVSGTNMK